MFFREDTTSSRKRRRQQLKAVLHLNSATLRWLTLRAKSQKMTFSVKVKLKITQQYITGGIICLINDKSSVDCRSRLTKLGD